MSDTSGPLDRDELAAYRRDGFVVPKLRLSDEALARLSASRAAAENLSIENTRTAMRAATIAVSTMIATTGGVIPKKMRTR